MSATSKFRRERSRELNKVGGNEFLGKSIPSIVTIPIIREDIKSSEFESQQTEETKVNEAVHQKEETEVDEVGIPYTMLLAFGGIAIVYGVVV